MPKQPDIPQPFTIGVLALQGAFDVHAAMLRSLGADPVLIRRPDQLVHSDGTSKVDGLVLPGGESSTFLRHLERDGFFDILNTFVRQTPTFGTCAGCILLATEVTNPAQRSFAALDITVERNAYGRQLDSTILHQPSTITETPLEMVFIRAPRITRIGPNVETLAAYNGDPVLVRQGHLLAATFHPELSSDTQVHAFFLDLVQNSHA